MTVSIKAGRRSSSKLKPPQAPGSSRGVAVIVRPIGGAMAEAAVGGQQLLDVPK
jgi:hypothetical protein